MTRAKRVSPSKTLLDQVRGATRLAVEATIKVADISEAAQHVIGGGPEVLGRPLQPLTKLFASPVYMAIRGMAGALGAVVDQALGALDPWQQQSAIERGPLLAIINGVVGDYLHATANPLATEMRLIYQRQCLDLSSSTWQNLLGGVQRLGLFVHGSCLDEACWSRGPHDHAAALAEDYDLMPLYVRYNSGKHISENGRELATMLESLVRHWPDPCGEIVVLAHSMGGLVMRSACHSAAAQGYSWPERVKALIMLGTPHHGAPLERAGSVIDTLLVSNRYSAPFASLGRLRSAGVTDLRYGYIEDQQWQGRDRFGLSPDLRMALRLPSGIDCFAVAGSIAGQLRSKMPGDGIVPVASALGLHREPALSLSFPADRQMIALGTSHLELLASRQVYTQIRLWLESHEPRQASTTGWRT